MSIGTIPRSAERRKTFDHMPIFDSKTRLPRDLQTQLQASADDFHMSFGSGCNLHVGQASRSTPSALGIPKQQSRCCIAGAAGSACSLTPPSRFRICRQHAYPGLLRGTAEHRKLSNQRHETPALRRTDGPARPVIFARLAGQLHQTSAPYQRPHGSAGRMSSKDRG